MVKMKVEKRISDYLNFLDSRKYRTVQQLSWQFVKEDKTRRTPPEDLKWSDINLPHPYGEEFTSFWFRATAVVPESIDGEDVFLYARPQSDSLVFLDGKPEGALNLHHERIRIVEKAGGGEKMEISLESYGGHYYPGCHPSEGRTVVLTLGKTIPDYPNVFLNGELQVKEEEIYDLYYNAYALYETALVLEKNSLRRATILKGLFDALINIHQLGDIDRLKTECLTASRQLKPLLEAKNGDTWQKVYITGHAHIDHAWLWPIAETDKKVARTFANMCRYAEEYPEFTFLQSQPAQLESVEKNYPEIFERIKDTFKKGQWEPNGGMWVEADCNIPSGESLIRQFMYGRKTTRKLLDYTGDCLWLPDVFGYSAALPQILKSCGIKYFVTSKINWNDTTRFPYDKFVWEGIDGTSIQTLFIPDSPGGYNGSATPANINESWCNIQHKEVQKSFIKSIGEGDGGGGTHRSDLEMARRLTDLEGTSRVEWKNLSDSLEDIFDNYRELPKWKGELYLELHRGTYTSQARTKRYNRKLEFQLSRVEMLYSLISILKTGSLSYPEEQLDRLWKNLLTHQFHDIIPGSSINVVYQDAEKEYSNMEKELLLLEKEAMGSLSESGSPEMVTVFNHLGFNRKGVFKIEDNSNSFIAGNRYKLSTLNNEPVSIQQDTDMDGNRQWLCAENIPSFGWRSFSVEKSGKSGISPFSMREDILETPYYTMKFSPEGGISSLKFKDYHFEYVAESSELNTFILAEDTPIFWDAWDIDADYRCKEKRGTRLLGSEVISTGPVLIRIRNSYSLGEKSKITQDFICYADSPRIDFETRIEWYERRNLLKVSFPLAIQSNEAVGNIQFGHISRPTHDNKPEDRARFEVCAQKWMAISDGKQTAAVLNDCKYGWDVQDGAIRLTLLKAPEAPDEKADYGNQEFTYSFLPSKSGFSAPEINREANDLNQPLLAYFGVNPAENEFSLLSLSTSGISAETVKQSEDGNGTVIRFFEAEGAAQLCDLSLYRDVESVELVSMLEDEIEELEASGNTVSLKFHPFEIKTLKIRFK